MEEQDKSQETVAEGEPFEIDELDDRDLESASGGVASPVDAENASGCNGSGCNTGC